MPLVGSLLAFLAMVSSEMFPSPSPSPQPYFPFKRRAKQSKGETDNCFILILSSAGDTLTLKPNEMTFLFSCFPFLRNGQRK